MSGPFSDTRSSETSTVQPAFGQTGGQQQGGLPSGGNDNGGSNGANGGNGSNIEEAKMIEKLEAGIPRDQLQTAKRTEGLPLFWFLNMITAVSAVYVSVSTWGFYYDRDTEHICPYRVVCATSWTELVLLTFSRLSAGALFASLSFSVVSKCNATKAFLNNSWIGSRIDFEPSHELHTYFGFLTLAAGWFHGILHIARFAAAGETFLLYNTDAGRSGVIALLMLLPVVLPMKYKLFQKRMSFETRKWMHMLFLALLLCICFHSYKFRFVGGGLLAWYVLDKFFFVTKQTYLVSHPTFEAIGRGTMVGIALPEGYHYKAGSYIYVNCPAIDRGEWHPFSLIPVPGKDCRAAFYAEAVGDWTKELFRLGLTNPSQPLWITAAQPSPVERTLYYDSVLLICTGAGVTPALAVAERFSTKKNIHLLWIARDHGMIALFEEQLRMVNSTVHLTGKPNDDVKRAMIKLFSSSRSPSDTTEVEDMPAPEGGHFCANDSCGLRSILESARESRDHSAALEILYPTGCHAVDLHFGKPDIPTFIEETLLEMSGAGQSGLIDGAGGSQGNTRQNKRGLSRQASGRLDHSQKAMKKALTTGNLSTIHHTDHGSAIHEEGNAPWIVIYCGANVHVEKAIATTCTELNVPWRKEYFGAW